MEQVIGTTSKIKQKDKENVKIEKKKNFFDRLAYIKIIKHKNGDGAGKDESMPLYVDKLNKSVKLRINAQIK